MKRKITSIILSIATLFTAAFAVFAINTQSSFADSSIPFKLYSDSALVCDMKTGDVLYSLNASERRYPASTTKMLTAILAIENLNLDDVVTVDKEATRAGGNSLKLKSGEKIVLRDLLYATLVVSANDGAVVLAKAVSGNVEEFAKLMNKKAEEIGCTGSHFVNPNGLHEDDHYTTAYDLATIAMYCMKNETFRDIVSHESYDMPATNMSKERHVSSTNWLLYDTVDSHKVYAGSEYRYCKYDGCIGIKTGQTSEAGCCLVAAATRDDTTVLTVCLHASNTFERFSDAIRLLDLGFSSFKTVQQYQANTELGTVKVKKGSVKTVTAVLNEDIYATLLKNESTSIITTEISLEEKIKAPVEEGQQIGTVTVYKSGEPIIVAAAVAKEAVPEGGFLSNFGIDDATAAKIKKVISIILIIILLFILGLTIWVIYMKIKIKKKKERKAARLKEKQ